MRISDLCKTAAGGTPLKSNKSFYDGGDIPWLLSGEVSNRDITETVNFITQAGLDGSSAKIFPPDTVLIAMYGATAGEVGILRCEASTNQAVCGIFPNKKVLPEYLYYFFLNHKKLLVAQAVGNAQPNISQQKIKNTRINLPPIPEQKRIVAMLDQAFADIERVRANTEQNRNNARALFDSYLQQVFSQRGEGWVDKCVGEILTLEYGKPLDKSLRKDDGIYPAYGANGVKTWSDQYYCEKKTIIVGRKGSAGELTLTKEKFWPLDVTYFVSFDDEQYQLTFIYYLLSRLNLPSLATGVKPGINRNNVYSLHVSVPPLDMQKVIAIKLTRLSKEILNLETIYTSKLDVLDQLKKSILQKAFSGELTANTDQGAAA